VPEPRRPEHAVVLTITRADGSTLTTWFDTADLAWRRAAELCRPGDRAEVV
jgi:hypothetical protein